MGRYCAHRFDRLPANVQAGLRRLEAMLYGDVSMSEQELADANAELDRIESRQGALELAPFPESIQVRAAAQACMRATASK